MDKAKLIRDAVKESLTPIRPGGVHGQPFWNTYATHFIWAPSFEFKEIRGAKKYVFTVTDRFGAVSTFEALTSQAALSPVWAKIPVGPACVTVEAFNGRGKSLGSAGKRTFYRCAAFTASYPPRKRSYEESAKMTYQYIFNLKSVQYLKCGEPDPDYWLYCYPSKMFAAIIRGMVGFAEMAPDKSAQALKIATKSADYLIKTAVPKDKDLAYFPQTYEGAQLTAAKNNGTIMMLYPAAVGSSMLVLAKSTGKKKYLDYAKKIGDTYLRLQQPDGNWFLIHSTENGKPTCKNFASPTSIFSFFAELSEATGCDQYINATKGSTAYFDNMIASFNWEGQFEDVEAQDRPYLNLSKHIATDIMFYLLKQNPKSRKIRACAREVARFAEDQFIVWEQPGWVWTSNPFINRLEQNDSWGWYPWHTPSVLEQYRCYTPVDASSAKMIRYFLKMYDIEKKPMDLAKARALGDSLTLVQSDEGRIPTWVNLQTGEGADWINCMFSAANALKLLSQYDKIKL